MGGVGHAGALYGGDLGLELFDQSAPGGYCGGGYDRHETGDRFAVAGQHDVLAGFGEGDELRELGVGFRQGDIHGEFLWPMGHGFKGFWF